MISATRKVRFVWRPNKSRAIVVAPQATDTATAGRVPRISRLIALAIYFDRLLREGKVRDQSELARLAHVTQPRMTQIMNLNHLAPEIQEQLLFLPTLTTGRSRSCERHLRQTASTISWTEQRREWQARSAIAGSDRSR